MKTEILLERRVADTALFYRIDRESGMVELDLLPAGGRPADEVAELNPIASVKFVGDSAGCGFGGGRTMRYNGTMRRFRFANQECSGRQITTELRDDEGRRLLHVLEWKEDLPVFFVHTELVNDSRQTVQVELLESFALGGIGESLDDRDFSELKLHRFRSHWCNEANHTVDTARGLLLERYPLNHVICNERYGQIGSLPTSGFHPFGAVEGGGFITGAMLAWNGSWQMEFSMHRAAGMALSGGLADRETGHWKKTLKPGETLISPTAMIAGMRGDIDDLCARLVRGIETTLDLPAIEDDLPAVFNEWCTSWGDPTEENMLAIADKLKGLPVRYLVIAAGWFKRNDGSAWNNVQGDWEVNSRLFPQGIAHTAAAIRERGLIPGIWFEAEVAGELSHSWERDKKHMLHREGKVLTTGTRRFWNLDDPEGFAILEKRVVDFIHDNGFGYIKIDYNDTIGVGCDDPDSPGEGLRKQMLGTRRFFRRLREVNPDLVVENCASGGFRLEPGMMALSSMSSFSDANEFDAEPVIAAALHRLMPARQMQIWAVMRRTADIKRIVYLLSTATMGRLCLSGDILDLADGQFETVVLALEFYRRVVPVLKDGDSRVILDDDASRKVLTGSQHLVRVRRDGMQAAVWFHAFHDAPKEIRAQLPGGKWKIAAKFLAPGCGELVCGGAEVILRAPAEMSGCAVLLERIG